MQDIGTPLLEYAHRSPSAIGAGWLLRGWAVTNWLAAVSALGIATTLLAYYGGTTLRHSPLIAEIVLLIAGGFATCLAMWGAQCWWYGRGVIDGDQVPTRQARRATLLLAVLWLVMVGSLAALRVTWGPAFFEGAAERIGWWIVGSGTSSFLAASFVTVLVLSRALRGVRGKA